MISLRGAVIGFIAGIAGLTAWASPGLAQSNAVSHSPAKVVEKYFALDNKGVRLDASSFESVAGYVDWKEEPAWGKVVVINGFTVPDDFRQWEIVNRLEVVVPVEFRVLGIMYLDTAGFVPEPGTEQARVRLKVMNGRWKIMEPILPPHVGQKRMLNVVRQAMLEEKDGTRQASLAALQAELRKAKE
ncbi:MAG: hypothetical protein ABS70_05430 [Nitrospira sp. SCN 59-13]|nr:MAG: hypothetical protein ABS70_05430 [Nitrospira sp. SCN 59-13]